MDIIDPPVGIHSKESEIRAWLDGLKQREQTDEVKLAIRQAEDWLKIRRDAASN